LIILLFACGQQKDIREDQFMGYIEKPSKTDLECINDIEKAKSDISKGKIVFCMSFYFLSFEFRYEKQLRQLCEKYNLIFDYEVFSDVVILGQTQGCYGAYMGKNIVKIAHETGAQEFHLSARKKVESEMIFCQTNVSMGGAVQISEYAKDISAATLRFNTTFNGICTDFENRFFHLSKIQK